MSEIQRYLDEIRNALYGEEVRSSIVNAINQCYQDSAGGIKPIITFDALTNGTRVNISVGSETSSFTVANGARSQFTTQRYTSSSVTCTAEGTGTVNIPITFPTGYDFVCVVDEWSDNGIVDVHVTTHTVEDGGNITLQWTNTENVAKTVTFTVNILFVFHIDEASGDDAVLNRMYPIGSVYISTSSANPSGLFGGTWRQIAKGRTLIGAGSIEANTTADYGNVTADSFAPTANEMGGSLHHDHFMNGTDANGAKAAIGAVNQSPNMIGYYAVTPSSYGPGSTGAYIVQGSQVSGSGTFSHYTPVYGYTRNNETVEPYLAVYIWERTA